MHDGRPKGGGGGGKSRRTPSPIDGISFCINGGISAYIFSRFQCNCRPTCMMAIFCSHYCSLCTFVFKGTVHSKI